MHDVRYALRMLRKQPGFAAVAVIALALGIGANSAVFSVANAILLRPLDVPRLDRLVDIRDINPLRPNVARPVTPADYLDWKERARSFEHIIAFGLHDYDVSDKTGDPEGVHGIQISADTFRTLRVRPALGRDFATDEDQPGHEQVVILSDSLWRGRFGGDPSIAGRTILLDSRPFLVVGVMPPHFDFPFPGAALFTPLPFSPAAHNDRRSHWVSVTARLRDGVSLQQARAEMDAQARRLAREYPDTNTDRGAGVVLFRERQGEISKPFLTLLQATALFVLLIACSNLANLQLAQAAARRREIAVRAALGAGRWRVARLLLTESLTLALMGGAAGVAVGYWGVRLIKLGVSGDTTRLIMGWSRLAIDPTVLLFTLGVTVVAGITFGISAALRASRVDLAGSLKDGGQRGASTSRTRRALIIAEAALAMVAVIGASQMARGFQAMFDVYQGFSPDHILALRLVLPVERYDAHRSAAFFDRAAASVATLPGVEAAAVSSNLPGALRFNPTTELRIEDKASITPAQEPLADVQYSGPGYFEELQIRVRRGRPIAGQDGENTPLIAVVNQQLAERCWPGEDPIGKRIRLDSVTPAGWRTVVGVVNNVHQFWFEKSARPLVYLPYRQSVRRDFFLVLRTAGNPMAVLPGVRDRIRALDASLPLHDPKPMRRVMLETLSAMQLSTGMMMVFGLLALVLAAVGVYGVTAYSVAQRNREFGIRMALGARPREVLRMVVWQGFVLTFWGIALGLALGFAVSRAMAGIMFGLGSNSIAVLAGATVLLSAVSLAACWVPARAVTLVDPVTSLRQE